MNISEKKLIGIISDQKKSIRRRENAFEKLVIMRHKDAMWHLIRRRGVLAHNVEDIYNIALMDIWKSLSEGRYEDQGTFKAWVLRITFNKTMNFFRKKMIKTIELNHEVFSIEQLSNETELIYSDELNFHMGSLNDEQKNVFNLYLEGYSHEEIAEKTTVKNSNSSKTMLYRIRQIFKKNAQ